MDAVDYMVASDAVIISSLQYSFSDDQNQLKPPPNPVSLFHLCPKKAPGELFLAFNVADLAQQLGYSLPLTDDAVFEGKRVVGSADRINWKLDQIVGRRVSAAGQDVTIEALSGNLSTEVDPLAIATKQAGCDGSDRFAEYTLRTVFGTLNQIDVRVTVHTNSILGDVKDTIHLTNISFAAFVCKAIDPRVGLSVDTYNDCSSLLAVVEGATVKLRARITNPPTPPQGAQLQVGWEWKVVGATSKPRKDVGIVSLIDVDLPSPPHQVAATVTATMTIPGLTLQASDILLISPTPAQYVKTIELWCTVRQELIFHPFVDPLGDPPRDLVARPFSHPELQAIRQWADRLVAGARSLQKEAGRLLDRVEGGHVTRGF